MRRILPMPVLLAGVKYAYRPKDRSCRSHCYTNAMVDPHCVSSTNVLTSGLARSLISAHKEFSRTWRYFPFIPDSVKAPIPDLPLNLCLFPFVKNSLYIRPFYSYVGTIFVRRTPAVLFHQ